MILLEARGITKVFPGVVALDNVDVSFQAGSIHGIVGENGAGKSTLIKILTGVYTPDQGKVIIEGEEVHGASPLFRKLAYVPQELDLFNHMTVAENLFMPFDRTGFEGFVVNRRRMFREARVWLDKFKISAEPTDLVKDISVSNQQLLQIARAAVSKYFEILVLDEPTTSLTTAETERLFSVMRELKNEGKAVIFISHKLDELMEICDEMTVLRNGVKVAYSTIDQVSRQWIIEHMTAKEITEDTVFRPESPSQEVLLDVQDLSGLGFSGVSFQLRAGEVLGFAGLVGSGRSEIMQTLFGFLPARGGRVTLGGQPFALGSTTRSISSGLVYLPEERKQHGILELLSVKDNITVSLMDQVTNLFVVNGRKEKQIAQQVVEDYAVKTPSLEQPIRFLSGGNQQKAIIGRAMNTTPRILIFDEPTKGIDVGAKVEIYRIMKTLAEQRGVGIILVSSDLTELLRCSNRVITIYEGRKTGEFDVETTASTAIMDAMFGESNQLNGKQVKAN